MQKWMQLINSDSIKFQCWGYYFVVNSWNICLNHFESMSLIKQTHWDKKLHTERGQINSLYIEVHCRQCRQYES